MPIFGQVWLWSSLAFLLGALLCWGLLALPARRRVGELEAELTARARRQPQNEPRRPQLEDEREDFDARRLLAGSDRMPERHEVEDGPLTRAYALAGSRAGNVSAPPEIDTELSDGPRSTATQYLNVSGSSTLEAPPELPAKKDLGWFDDKARRDEDSPAATTVLPSVPAEPADSGLVDSRLVDSRLVDDVDSEAPDGGGTVFTQHTHPIPGELIRRLDNAEAPQEPRSEPAHALVDDIEDEAGGAQDEEERGILAELDGSGESKHQLSDDPEVTSVLMPATEVDPASVHGGQDRTEVVPAHTAEAQDKAVSASGRHGAAGDHSTPGAEEPKIMPGVNVQAEPTNKLPKRVPSKPPRRTPFGVQTTSPATPEATTTATTDQAPAEESVNEAPRALFEPVVPAGDGPETPPPPHRMRGVANGRGPFGPGSAMPGPGGKAPSPDFTVKASASAMRYCTQESDNYERTVAEVWFRSAAEAERVGFRPLG